MNGLLALVALVLAALSYWYYVRSAQTIGLIAVIVFGLAFIGLGGLFLSGRVNKNDDVHITE